MISGNSPTNFLHFSSNEEYLLSETAILLTDTTIYEVNSFGNDSLATRSDSISHNSAVAGEIVRRWLIRRSKPMIPWFPGSCRTQKVCLIGFKFMRSNIARNAYPQVIAFQALFYPTSN